MPSLMFNMPSMATIISLLLYHHLGPHIVQSNKDIILPSFSWDPRNECFNASKNTDNGFHLMKVDQDSQMYFLCPSIAITYDVQTSYLPQKKMYENMIMCSEEEFRECKLKPITNASIDEQWRMVMKCDYPLETLKLKYYHFSFTQVRSSIADFAFEAGRTYYFIATSNGSPESLDAKQNGRCSSNNMRLAIEICAHGKNCHLSNKRCKKDDGGKSKGHLPQYSPTTRLPAQTVQTTLPQTTPVITDFPDISDIEPIERAQQRGNAEGSSMGKKNVLYITLAAIGGLFVGILLSAGIWSIKKASHNRNTKRYSGAPSTATEHVTVEDGEEEREEDTNSGSVKIEVMNQKYFTSVDFRHSNEFHRLISTASTCSTNRHSDSERHCVTPIGGYK